MVEHRYSRQRNSNFLKMIGKNDGKTSMLPFMNLNEFADNIRKTKCLSRGAPLISIPQTAKILFKLQSFAKD